MSIKETDFDTFLQRIAWAECEEWIFISYSWKLWRISFCVHRTERVPTELNKDHQCLTKPLNSERGQQAHFVATNPRENYPPDMAEKVDFFVLKK